MFLAIYLSVGIFSTWWQTENDSICVAWHTPVWKRCWWRSSVLPHGRCSVYQTPLAYKLPAGWDLNTFQLVWSLRAWHTVCPTLADEVNEQKLVSHLSCSFFILVGGNSSGYMNQVQFHAIATVVQWSSPGREHTAELTPFLPYLLLFLESSEW